MGRGEGASGWRQLLTHMRLPLCMFAALAVLAAAGILLLRATLLRNAREAATAFSRSCAAEEQGSLNVYETLLTFGTSALEERLEDGESREQILAFLDMYFQRVDTVLGDGVVDPYVVLDGEILSARPWEGDASYDYTSAPWYVQALAAGGEVAFTQVYTDAVYDRPVVTAAQSCRNGTVVMAFDILPEHLRFDTADLTEEDSFFLCDGSGTLIYQETGVELPREELQDYLTWLVEQIRSGELEDDPVIRDLNGQSRGVYYTRMDNGWYCIVTVPYARLLGGLRSLIWPLLLMFAVSLLALAALSWREMRLTARIRRADETARVLGNRYYALYRVDYERETYQMIKGSDYVRDRLPPAGPYSDLLRTAGEVIEADAYRDFTESFSCENIRQLVQQKVWEFGGEFLRRFGRSTAGSACGCSLTSPWPGARWCCASGGGAGEAAPAAGVPAAAGRPGPGRQNEASKQTFFRNMSHDMRTPLNAIIGLTELARQHPEDTARVSGYLERIGASGRYLLGLINDILDMARMEHGAVRLEQRQFRLKTCVEEILAPFRIQAEAQGKTLTEDFRAGDPSLIGDPFRLQQILNNLLSNALKFTRREGRSLCPSAVRTAENTRNTGSW